MIFNLNMPNGVSQNTPPRVNYLYFNDMAFSNAQWLRKIILKLNSFIGKKIKRKSIAEMYAGWGWFSWHKQVAEFVLSAYKSDKAYFRRFYMTFCCDEILFHTLLYPHIKELNINTNNSLRYINWTKVAEGRSSSYRPLLLNEEELEEIENSDCMFCRKIDSEISKGLIKILTNKILYSDIQKN